jgi:hypothetical protein
MPLTRRSAPVTSAWKPYGYSSVSPYLIAENAQGVLDFLRAAFGATELRRFDMPDGTIMHVEMRVGDTVVMLGDARDEHEWDARGPVDVDDCRPQGRAGGGRPMSSLSPG